MFPNYAPEQHKIGSIALQDSADELQEAIDTLQPTTYTITTHNCNMEDVLHKLFTQLYDDDLFFDLVIDRSTSEVDITFTTAYPQIKVDRVLSGYNVV